MPRATGRITLAKQLRDRILSGQYSSRNEAAASLGIHPSLMSDLQAMLELPEEVQTKIETGEIGFWTGALISRIAGPSTQRRLARHTLAGKLSRERLRTMAADAGKQRSVRDRHLRKRKRTAQKHGFVYLLACAGMQYVKIGRSATPRRRGQTMGLPMPQILHTIPSDDAVWAEKAAHALYAQQRVDCEWFDLPSTHISFMQKIARWDRDCNPVLNGAAAPGAVP